MKPSVLELGFRDCVFREQVIDICASPDSGFRVVRFWHEAFRIGARLSRYVFSGSRSLTFVPP